MRSGLLGNGSVLGQALRILIGYDARPSGIRVVFYLSIVCLPLAGMRYPCLPGRPGGRRRVAHPGARGTMAEFECRLGVVFGINAAAPHLAGAAGIRVLLSGCVTLSARRRPAAPSA